jgi:hypothetical protein
MRTPSLLALQVLLGGALGVASSELWTLGNGAFGLIANWVACSPALCLAALVVESALGVRARSLGLWIIAGMVASIAQSAAFVSTWWLGGGTVIPRTPNLIALLASPTSLSVETALMLGPLVGLLAGRFSRYLDSNGVSARWRPAGRLLRAAKWPILGALAVSASLWAASWVGNFAIRAGVFTVMMNDGVLELGTLDGRLYPYGWQWQLVSHSSYITYYGHILLRVPVVLLSLIVLALAVWVWRNGRRAPPGRCTTCGYDLTGNVSHVCPECGTPAPHCAQRPAGTTAPTS